MDRLLCLLPTQLANIVVYYRIIYRRRRRRRRRGSVNKISEVSTKKPASKQSTNLNEGEAAPADNSLVVGGSDHGGPSTVPSLSSRVPVISTDHWAVRPQPWLHTNTAAKHRVTGSKVTRSEVNRSHIKRSRFKRSEKNTAAKPGRYSDVIGPFD